MCEWGEDSPGGLANEEQQDPTPTPSFHLSDEFAAIPTYFKAFHTFRGETVYYFQEELDAGDAGHR